MPVQTDNQGGGPAKNVQTGRVLAYDWAAFDCGPYERLPSDRDAVLDSYLMQRYDPTVGAALTVIKQLICSNLGQYKHEDDATAEWVNAAMNGLRGGLRKTVASLLSCLWAGFAVGEKVWATEEMWRIESINLLHPLTFWDRMDGKPGIVYDKQAGRVTEVSQMKWNVQDEVVAYPVEQVVYWPFWQELREEVFGKRITDRARRNWYMRSKLEAYWSTFLQYFAAPTPIFRVPKGSQIDPKTGEPISNSAYYSKFIQELGPGNGLAVEAGPEDEFSFDLLESKIGSDRAFETATGYHNSEIFKALLMSPMLLEEPQHGSRAQAGTALDMFLLLVEAIRDELGAVLVEQIAQPMIAYNLGATVEPGEWAFQPIESDDLEMLARCLDLLKRSGAVSFADADERQVREKFAETGLVPLDEITPEERAAAQEAARVAPAGFGL